MLNKVEVGNLVRFYEYGHCGDIVEGIVVAITPHILDNQLEVKQLFTNDIWVLSDKNVTVIKSGIPVSIGVEDLVGMTKEVGYKVPVGLTRNERREWAKSNTKNQSNLN